MFQVKTEDFTAPQTTAISTLAGEVAALAAKAAKPNSYPNLRTRWFGAQAVSDALQAKLEAMDTYLNKECQLITFVKKSVGHQVDSVAVEDSDYGQVIPNIGRTTANFKPTEYHVSSGLRVFAMNEYFAAVAKGDRVEMLNYVYHEVTHKVLDTIDHAYGPTKCKRLALTQPERALNNADNFGYFIADIDAGG